MNWYTLFKMAQKQKKFYHGFAIGPDWSREVVPLDHAYVWAFSPQQAKMLILRRQDRSTREVESYLSLEDAGWRVVFREEEPQKPKPKEIEQPEQKEIAPVTENQVEEAEWF